MENNPENTDQEIENMIITEDIRSFIYDTAKWTKFLSIVGFVLTALMVITAFSLGSIINSGSLAPEGVAAFSKMSGSILTFVMLLYALLVFYPSFLLFKYANSAKQAVLYNDNAALAVSAKKLRAYFKYLGILTIVMIVLNAFAFLLKIVNSAGRV